MAITISWIVAFVLIVGVGVFAGRKVSSAKEWSGGDKTMGALAVGCVLGAWQIGGMSIVGAAQDGYNMGIAGAWYSIAGSFYFLIAALLAKLIREKIPGDSVPSFLASRYSKHSARLYSYIWVLLGFLYIPVQLKTVSTVIQIAVPGMNTNLAIVAGLTIAVIYTSFSGMRGAASVGKIVCIGIYIMLVAFVALTLPKFSGFSGLTSVLPESYRTMSTMPTQRWVAWIIGGIISSIVMQSVLQPIMAAKDAKAARRGCLIGFCISAPICLFTATIGMMAAATTNELGNGATAFAWTIKEFCNPVVAGVIFAIATMIISATMATMMMSTGTVLTNIYKDQINPDASEEKTLKFSRCGTLVFSFCTLIPAFLLPSDAMIFTFMLLMQCATVPISFSMIAGLFWKRATKEASMVSMIVGIIVSTLWIVSGMYTKIEIFYVSLPASYLAGIITALMTSKREITAACEI